MALNTTKRVCVLTHRLTLCVYINQIVLQASALIKPWLKTLSTNTTNLQKPALNVVSKKTGHLPLTVLSDDEKMIQETGNELLTK